VETPYAGDDFITYYSLTDLGKSLMPAIDGLVAWAKENLM